MSQTQEQKPFPSITTSPTGGNLPLPEKHPGEPPAPQPFRLASVGDEPQFAADEED